VICDELSSTSLDKLEGFELRTSGHHFAATGQWLGGEAEVRLRHVSHPDDSNSLLAVNIISMGHLL
jgi:hypothetical protein